MASRKPTLTVVFTHGASDELNDVWRQNAKQRGVDHADSYDEFLKQNIAHLATDYDAGKGIDGFPELQRMTFKTNSRRSTDGHTVIYEVDAANKTASILHVFHTKMDLEGRLKRERQ